MAMKYKDGEFVEETAEEVADRQALSAMAAQPTIESYTGAITAMLNSAAKERRYDDALSIATYVGSANAQWAAEAQAFVAWRDQIWGYCYTELDRVQAAARPQPTVDAFLEELQAAFPLTWPSA